MSLSKYFKYKKVKIKKDKILYIINLLSKLSTVGILILAIFSYFYTIKPTFELATIKKEKRKLLSEIESIKWDIFIHNCNVKSIPLLNNKNAEPFEFLSKQENKEILNKNAPYVLLHKQISSLNKKTIFFITDKLFIKFKIYMLKYIEKNKDTLTYAIDIKEYQNNYNKSINKIQNPKVINGIKHYISNSEKINKINTLNNSYQVIPEIITKEIQYKINLFLIKAKIAYLIDMQIKS